MIQDLLDENYSYVLTARFQSDDENYSYVLTARFQSDPLERHFTKYRQMSGGRFLVALREVRSSVKIIQMKTLAKEGIQFWELDLQPNGDHMGVIGILEIMSNEIQDCELNTESSEIATYLVGFISKKLLKKTICKECKLCEDILTSNLVEEGVDYINQLNRGGLRIPSKH